MICTAHPNFASDKIKKNEMGGALACMVEGRSVYRVLVGKSEGKRPLGKPRRRWEDNIKIYLQEVGRYNKQTAWWQVELQVQRRLEFCQMICVTETNHPVKCVAVENFKLKN